LASATALSNALRMLPDGQTRPTRLGGDSLYGADVNALAHRAASYVERAAVGSKPVEIKHEQTSFSLRIPVVSHGLPPYAFA